MTQIRSTWTLSAPPPLTGLLTAAEWSAAASMTIPLGKLLAQNDATHLYIGLDATAQTGTPNVNDYFQFLVDINGNGQIDPYRDIGFGIIQGNLNHLYQFYMVAPHEETGVQLNQVIPSLLKSGFGPSLNSATPHRQWQISFALSDLGIDPIDPAGPTPIVEFGLLIGTVGGVEDESPANADGDFSDFHQIVLATVPAIGPPLSSHGPVIATVGLIGTGDIASDGYATITAPYYFNPNPYAAAFCGTLNLLGNVATLHSLWLAGATKYKVLHRYGATAALANSASWNPILQSWANFEIVGVNDVWQSFGPDGSGYYPFVNPGVPYTIQNLLFQWTTSAEPDGVHQFQIDFFNTANHPVGSTVQILTLALDNQPPIVDLINVLHNNAAVLPCTMVNLTSATDGVQIQFEASDPEGDLYSLGLTANWGHGNSAVVYSDGYGAHVTPTSHVWQGVTNDTRPAPPAVWVPPTTCAYLFEITATTRTTNGYSYPVIYSQDFQTVTLIKPTSATTPMLATRAGHTYASPAGFEKLPGSDNFVRMTAKKLPKE